MTFLQGTVADSLDSSEDDIFDGKLYLTKNNKDYNKKKFLLSSKHPKINVKREMPNTIQKSKNIQQNCNMLSNVKKSKSQENFLSAINMRNDNTPSVYIGSYSAEAIPYFSKMSAQRRNFKIDQKHNRDWIQPKDSCSAEGVISGE